MLHVTIKTRFVGDLIEVETYDPDLCRLDWRLVAVKNLWRWLNERRPAFVYRRGRCYRLGA